MTSLKTKPPLNKGLLYLGEDFKVDEQFIIHQPKIQEIFNIGESEFFSTLNIFIGNTTMYRLPLWKQGIDWNKISDFELFIMLLSGLEPNKTTQLLFGDIDFTQFKHGVIPQKNAEDNDKIIIFDLAQNLIIDEDMYLFMREGLRYMFNIYPKTEFAKGKTTKEWIIGEEKDKIKAQEGKPSKDFLLPLISFCVNHPGFKYKTSELKEVGIVEFMDSVKQLQHNENVIALLHGVNSGFVDASKIPQERFNFIREEL